MHSYTVYGLCLHSDIPLPGFLEGGRVPDIEITRRTITKESLGHDDWGGRRISGFLGEDEGLVCDIQDGRRVYYDTTRPMEEGVVRGYLTGLIMSVLLRQRGHVVLHASAVERNGEAFCFVGESGWGKSTLAEAFLQRGYTVLTDDLLVLRVGDKVEVAPGPHYIRLRPAAGAALLHDYETLPPVASVTDQRVRTITREDQGAVRVERLYILDPESASESAVVPLAPQEAILHLLAHSWGKWVFTDPDYQAQHLGRCAAIIRKVPVKKIRRVRTFEALKEHIALVERDVNALVESSVGS